MKHLQRSNGRGRHDFLLLIVVDTITTMEDRLRYLPANIEWWLEHKPSITHYNYDDKILYTLIL
jgi:hypothetical protein